MEEICVSITEIPLLTNSINKIIHYTTRLFPLSLFVSPLGSLPWSHSFLSTHGCISLGFQLHHPPHTSCAASWLLPPQHLFHLLALCQTELRANTSVSLAPLLPAKPLIKGYSCRTDPRASQRCCMNEKWEGIGENKHKHHQYHCPIQKHGVAGLFGGKMGPFSDKTGWIAIICFNPQQSRWWCSHGSIMTTGQGN